MHGCGALVRARRRHRRVDRDLHRLHGVVGEGFPLGVKRSTRRSLSRQRISDRSNNSASSACSRSALVRGEAVEQPSSANLRQVRQRASRRRVGRIPRHGILAAALPIVMADARAGAGFRGARPVAAVLSVPAGNAVPSAFDPVMMSWVFGLSPRPLTTAPSRSAAFPSSGCCWRRAGRRGSLR
mgnify:CR=1 FL=1